jgi:TrmH family RNA methyltransferase
VVAASRLHRARDRREAGATLLEGPNVIGEAIEAGVPIIEFYVHVDDDAGRELASRAGVAATPVEQAVLDRLAGTETPRGPVAVIEIPEPVESTRDAVSLEIADPGNAGTILRSSAAFGFDVVSAPGSTDLWSPKVLRAGAGAHFHTNICRSGPTATIATVVEGGVAPDRLDQVLDLDRRWSILVGSEAHGLTPDAANTADVRVTIPMPGGIESLNAAVAASIVMYEISLLRL